MTTIISDFSAIQPYLDGTEFNENLRIDYKRGEEVVNRNDIIVKLCENKRVLHVGCTDHVPLIAQKIRDRNWMHGLITECAAYTLGVDIDADAVREASSVSKLNNMIAGDITSPTKIPEISREKFDFAVFGEVVEHISNPVRFLSDFLENYKDNFERIVITVPSAFRGGNIKGILSNVETINSDHRFFFTPYTISKIAVDAGYRPESVRMATFSRAGALKSWILNRRPLLAEDIILIATHRG